MPVILSRKDLRQLLKMADVIEAVERGFREYKTGRCAVPVRMPVRIERAEGVFLFMPAYLERESSLGTKIISVFPKNLISGLSTLQSVYLLNDPTTGEFLALMDGILLTAMRTGADLGEIVLGKKPARTKEDEFTLFESVGFALEDLVTARLAYQRAKEKRMGLEFRLDDDSR